MSVINQVLNDIEQRDKKARSSSASLEPLVVVEPGASKIRVALVVIAFMTLVLGLWFSQETLKHMLANQEQAPQTLPPSTADVIVAKVIPIEPTVQRKAEPVIQQRLKNNDDVVAKTMTPSEPEARKASDSEVVDEATEVTTNQHTRDVTTAVAQDLSDVSTKQPTEQSIQQKNKPVLTIKPVALTSQELAQLKYKQGLQQQNAGKITKAQQSWQAALLAQPTLHQARESLAASYYGAKEIERALQILHQGNSKFPQYEGYRLLMAQILFQRQQPHQALAALNKPYLAQHASNESLSLAGSIAQSIKAWPQAQSNYQRLLARDATNPKWLIGLAIALDAQQKFTQASERYRQFMALPNVEQSLYQYAKGRLSQLKAQSQTRDQDGQS